MENLRLLQAENQRLKRAVDELSVLNELAGAIGALKTSDEVIRKIIGRSLRAVDAEQGIITLVEEQPDLPTKTLVRASVSSSEHDPFHIDQALLGWMVLNKKPLTVNSPASDERFHGLQWDDSIRSVLCVPMLVRSLLRGVLAVYNKKDGEGFTEDDQRLLAIIASQSAQVVENARLYEEEQALIRMHHELKLASQIQMDLLPKEAPKFPGYDIAGATFPAGTVGGDYFDFIPLSEHRLALCLGDISGKGLPAALLMTNLQASLQGLTISGNSVRDCVAGLNRHLYKRSGPEKFATLFYATVDTMSHELTYCNAGHEPPFLLTEEHDPIRLREGGTVIGVGNGFEYEQSTIRLKPGDVLVVYSDGVTEAMDLDKEQFGEEKLRNLITENAAMPAGKLIEEILRAVKEHSAEAPQHDDITALVVKRVIA